MLEKIDFAGNY